MWAYFHSPGIEILYAIFFLAQLPALRRDSRAAKLEQSGQTQCERVRRNFRDPRQFLLGRLEVFLLVPPYRSFKLLL